MPLPQGTRFGPYEIVAPIGARGMGEVYKALDTRLDRTVAIKVLPLHFAAREDLRTRFEREARAISSLNHPHICTLHDVGNQDGIDYLVMEHLAGETLANRIERGPLPAGEVLKYAMQIADALDRAHRSGIVHRDLKPGNVMLTRDGAKVLDFGLARTPRKAAAANAETLTRPLTSEGTILGTPEYMSPEQIGGGDADARSDIFAFGCVMYEMITGKRAFEGKTAASVLVAVLGAEPPPIRSLQPLTPPALEKLVGRCLEKNPENRYHCLRDVFLDLRSVGTESLEGPLPRRRVAWTSWVIAGVSLAIAALAGMLWLRQPATAVQSFEFTIGSQPRMRLDAPSTPVISPDGGKIVFEASDGKTLERSLWVRHLNSADVRPVAGTLHGTQPFWSPDGRSVADVSYAGWMYVLWAGIFQGSFMLPMKWTKGWVWENTWLVFAATAYLICPWLLVS